MTVRSTLILAAKIGAVLASSALIMVLTVYFSIKSMIFGNEITVPDLVGHTVPEATAALQPLGLTLEATPGEYDPRVPEGAIMSQAPAAGTATKPKRKVRVTVSRGTKTVLVPDFAKQSERTAALAIEKQGLTVGTVARVSAPMPMDQIIAQDPSPSSTTFPGEKVSLLVSRGPREQTWVMPDLTGYPRIRVERALEEHGLRISEVTIEASSAPEGWVLRQQPQSGYPITRRETVTLVVSGGLGWQPGSASPMIPSR